MKKPTSLTKSLASAVVEKDVENAYRAALAAARVDAVISSPHGCDGLLAWGDVRLLLECKLDVNMKARADVARVLAQVVFYVQRFAAAGEALPNVILLADRNECCVLPLAALQGYLADAFDWSLAPSSPDPRLVQALAATLNFVPHVFDVGPRFTIGSALEAAESLARGATHTIRATLANVGTIFGHVFKGSLGPVDQVDVFLRCLFDPTDVYLHPKRKGSLVVPGYAEGVQVHADRYVAFFDTFAQGYKPSEIEAFYAAKDRLIDDDARRRQGAFFTPRIWVDEAHRTIESVLGPTWREECIVWDPACGTGNLTRDYTFADLILSTAERSDVETIKAQGYNPGASVFQYDFLNPGAPSLFFAVGEGNEAPAYVNAQLRAAAATGKRLVFIMNPPYGTANNLAKDGTSKAGIASTRTGQVMKDAGMQSAAAQLYTQFIYSARVIAQKAGFDRFTIAVFSNVNFMTSGAFKNMREWLYGCCEFKCGLLLRADQFADVSGSWGIAFTVWGEGATDKAPVLDVCELQGVDVVRLQSKQIYSADKDAAAWVRCIRGARVDAPQLSSGLVVKEVGRGGLAPATLGFFGNESNKVQNSATAVYLMSSADTRNNGVYIGASNFRRCMALFAARKLVTGTWINDKDEYLAPNETAPGYAQWNDDAHVYALLHPSNNCTAMRSVPYKGRDWTISNHLFWLPRAEALAALDTSHTPALYRDCKATPAGYVVPKPADAPREQWEVDGDPYLAHVLPSLALSPEARDVLDRLRALWLRSLPVREAFAAERPELHLLAWDAGVYQLKHLWREHFAEDWEALREAHRKLADRMRPGVYDFGFLLR